MAVFKCKLCGGTIEPRDGGIGICDSCGTKQTVPNVNDEKKMNLLDRANHFRMQNDFDKAMAIYEQILDEDTTDSDVYYSIALCRYGITYVDDPKSKRKIPTINRMQNKQFSEDADFKMAIKYAKPEQEKLYSNEGAYIDKVQQGIMDITKNEKPYDVFICYKETDDNGERTHDSVLANDLYYGLTNEGFKVFFARITLEGKLGTAYEPYIFSALNSSKVMVVLGTKKEYFNAVWVKNEWSRFLTFINNGEKKTLIPAYKDMDPYDLPDEFANLQAQDMSKLGFMQDLIRGIKKIIGNTSEEGKGIAMGGNEKVEALLKRVKIFLSEGDFQKADEYCEKALDVDAEEPEIYFYKLMVETKCKNETDLIKYRVKPLDSYNSYIKAMKYSSDKQKEKLNNLINENIYYNANVLFGLEDYGQALQLFEKNINFKDSNDKIEACKERLYNKGIHSMESSLYDNAIKIFNEIIEYKDSRNKIEECYEKIAYGKYSEACMKMQANKYMDAIKIFNEIIEYKDSKNKIEECNYNKNKKLYENGLNELKNKNYAAALNCFYLIPNFQNFQNSAEIIKLCTDSIKEEKYKIARSLFASSNYNRALLEFKEILDYKDSKILCIKCIEKVGKINEYSDFYNGLKSQVKEENKTKNAERIEKAKEIAGKVSNLFNKIKSNNKGDV